MTSESPPLTNDAILALQQGNCHDPFSVLGRHPAVSGVVVRTFLPTAETAQLDELGEMQRVEGSDVFERYLTVDEAAGLATHYRIHWQEAGGSTTYTVISPYCFAPQLHDDDLHYFAEGNHHHAYRLLGAHPKVIEDVQGVLFAVWAPAVSRVSIVGDFNGWNGLRHPMRVRGSSGVWELFIPGLKPGDLYKFEIRNAAGHCVMKADPYAQQMTLRPDTACKVATANSYVWQDEAWLRAREGWDWQHRPMSIYELHPGSWRRDDDGGFLGYRALADQLVPYLLDMGYTHLELMPVMEHPLDESWGYQVSGYYAATARFGEPDDLRYLIDCCHQNSIGVILDWVPGHFPKDEFALARFTGEALYEHADPRRGEHRDWGTLIFDYARNEVRNFLLANAVYWLEEFHIDGLRVDAVASMLYLDYSRDAGDWLPNEFGGRENLDAVRFLQQTNEVIHGRFPGVVTIAEESTAWPKVSRPVWMDGLGFSMKWNMGWMNDTLAYMEEDPVHRSYHHNKLTFGQVYAYSENFVLPFSHDEVVHMKGSLLDKMPGDMWQKFANLRLLLTLQMTHPGKKLLFMGGEMGQWLEWDQGKALDWDLLLYDTHKGVQAMVRDLNHLYRAHPALYAHDFEQQGFEWLECDDKQHSVLAYARHGQGEHLLCVFNFTPVPRQDYRIPVPDGGRYREIFNSDSAHYSGSNTGNGEVLSEAVSVGHREQSVTLGLPPLGALILQRQN